jgi:hypothetical protein
MIMKKLFIDDFDLADRAGLQRIFHKAEKLPAPVVSPEFPWEIKTGREGVACPKVIYDEQDEIYKMWYWSSVDGLNNLYATSTDGISWNKPNLGLVSFNGSVENNLVQTPARIGPGAVLYNPESVAAEGDDKLFKTVSWLPSSQLKQRYIPIFSGDGLKWHAPENIDQEPGISGPGVGDTGTVMQIGRSFPLERDDVPGRYVAFPRLNAKVGRWDRRSVGMTACNTTPNRNRLMLDWPVPVLVLAPDFLDDEMARERLKSAYADKVIHYSDPLDHRCEFYTMQPWSVGDVFLGVVYVFDVSMNMDKRGAWNQHGIMEIQLVYSRDLVHWDRLGNRQPWIGRGAPGTFDDTIVHFASTPVQIGDKMYIYYTGTNIPHPTVNHERLNQIVQQIKAGKRHATQHIGCAVFRPDGYVSLAAQGQKGSVLTKPFVLNYDTLHVNTKTETGKLTVTVCDDRGTPIDGFVSSPISGDFVDKAVVFSRPLQQLDQKAISLKFDLEDGQLFSYTLA